MERTRAKKKITMFINVVLFISATLMSFASANMLTSNPVTISRPVYQLEWYIKDGQGNDVSLDALGVEGFSRSDTLFPGGAAIQRSDIPAYPAGDGVLREYPEVNGYFTGRWVTENGTQVGVGTVVHADMKVYAEYAQQARQTFTVTTTDMTDYGTLGASRAGSLTGATEVTEHSDLRLWWTYPTKVSEEGYFALDWVSVNGERVTDYPTESTYLDLTDVMENLEISFAFKRLDPDRILHYSAYQEPGTQSDGISTVSPAEGYVEIGDDVRFDFDMFYTGSQKNEIARVMINGERVSDFKRGSWSYTVHDVQEPFTLTYAVVSVSGKDTITVVPSGTLADGATQPEYSFTFSGQREEDTEVVRSTIQAAIDSGALSYRSTYAPGAAGTTFEVALEGAMTALDAEYFVFFDSGKLATTEASAGSPPVPDVGAGHRVQITSAGNGVITQPVLTDETTTVLDGAPLTIVTQPSEGYTLDTVDCYVAGMWVTLPAEQTGNTCTIAEVTGDLILRVSFRAAQSYSMTFTAEGGTIIEPAGGMVTVAEGQEVALRFEPNPGFVFRSAEIQREGGERQTLAGITQAGGTVTGLSANAQVFVRFSAGHTVTLDAVGGTITSPAGGRGVTEEDGTLTIAYEKAEGYVFRAAQVKIGNGEWIDVPGATEMGCTLTGITQDAAFRVTFTQADELLVWVQTSDGGRVTSPALAEDGSIVARANEPLAIGYEADADWQIAMIQTRTATGDWAFAEIGETAGVFTLPAVTENTWVKLAFEEKPSAVSVEISPMLAYYYGDEAPTVADMYVDAPLMDDEIATIRQTAMAAYKSGQITAQVEADSQTPAKTEVAYTSAGSADLLGDGYVVSYGSGKIHVSPRPVLIMPIGKEILLGQTYERVAEVHPYEDAQGNKLGGSLHRDDLKFDIVVQDGPVAEIFNYTLAVSYDPLENPNYEIHTTTATLKVKGSVTYKTNYPEGSGLEEATFTDPITYERGAIVTTPKIGDTGFNATGLTFRGWIINGKTYNAGVQFKMGQRNVELKADWKKTEYALTVLHYAEGTTTAVATPETFNYAQGETYTVKAKQVTGYTAVEATKTGTMPANDLTITMYYKAPAAGDGTGDGTGGDGGNSVEIGYGSGGGGSGGSGGSGGGGGGGTGDGTGDTGNGVDVSFGDGGTGAESEGGGSVGGGDGGGSGEVGGGGGGSGMGGPSGSTSYTIQESDVPLGGITSRNVGDCFE